MVPVFGFNGSTSFRSLADERFQDELPTGLGNKKKTLSTLWEKKDFFEDFHILCHPKLSCFEFLVLEWLLPGTQILVFVIILLQRSNYLVPESAGENGCYLNSLIIQ